MSFNYSGLVYLKKVWLIYWSEGVQGLVLRIKYRMRFGVSHLAITQNTSTPDKFHPHQWHLFFKKNYRHDPARKIRSNLQLSNKHGVRIGAIIRCCNGLPEQLLSDLALQNTPLSHVWLLGNIGLKSNDLTWQFKAWCELNKDLPFKIKLLQSVDGALEAKKLVDYVFLMESSDRVQMDAAYLFTDLPNKNYDFIYCDHDQIGNDYLHVEPSLKPDWSPDLLLCNDYIEGCLILKSEHLDSEILNQADDPAWVYKHLLSLDIYKVNVWHIPVIIWSKGFSNNEKIEYFHKAAKVKILEIDSKSTIEIDSNSGYRSILWSIPTPAPLVSIIIPTVGRLEYLEPCISSIRRITNYQNLELVFLDNSRGKNPGGINWLISQGFRVIKCNQKFNWSKLNNIGAEQAKGDLFLFLNDDIEIIDPRWLDFLVSNACRPSIGCVGTLLLYPSGKIQHAGVFLVNHGGGARHWFHRQEQNESLYKRLDLATREVSAVTGACLMVRKELFTSLGGFNEDLVISNNDIDFCLRTLTQGLRNLYIGATKLIHHESVHRSGIDCSKDENKFWENWSNLLLTGDRFHNPQFNKHSSDCVVDYSKSNITEKNDYGVNVVGYLTSEMGLGEAARGLLSALEAAHIPFDAVNYSNGNPSRCMDMRWIHRFTDVGSYSKTIFVINADWLPTVAKELSAQLPNQNYIIGYWAWELDQFPDYWQPSIDFVDEIWVASEHVLKGLRKVTDKSAKVIPYALDVDTNIIPNRKYFTNSDDRFVFLTMFDTHSIVERKNPYGAILAFKKAFSSKNKKVLLIIKVNNANQKVLKILADKIGNYENITIIKDVMTRHEVNCLIQSCNVYLSLHKAEGFGLQIAEAMWFGRPAIATNYSGNTSYMSHHNSILLPYVIDNIGPDNAPYNEYFNWANPDLSCASAAMFEIYNNKNLYNTLSKAAWRDIRMQLGSNIVGKHVKNVLNL